jgi:hypothetical protein
MVDTPDDSATPRSRRGELRLDRIERHLGLSEA